MMIARLRGWALIVYFAVCVALVAPLLLMLFFFFRNKNIITVPVRFFIRLGLKLVGVQVEVEGAERLDPRQTYVFVSNHQSLLDIVVLLVSVKQNVAFLAKKELFRLPLLYPGLSWIDCVAIDRSHPERAIHSIHAAARKLKHGVSFVAYPEGTRTRDGRLQPFKKGAFFMAVEAGVPIVPITTDGAFDLMPRAPLRCLPGTVRLIIHEPLSTEGYTAENVKDLVAKVREMIASRLPDSIGEEQPCQVKFIST